MFSDSVITKSFTLGRAKCSYFINFGVAPYLKELLLAKRKFSDFFVTCYDGLLNQVFQEEQMDVVLRYFNNESCMVETSYFDSAFLKRPNSQNLHNKLLESLTALDLGKLIQILMDGPNVNWDVLSLHSSYREKNEFSRLINIGSCGLHVLHGALQTGIMETDWEVNKVLHAMWKIFDESPARRDIYIRETGCDIFPLHFCKTRWVEDEPVAARGIQIWENIVQVMKYWHSLPKSKHPHNNKSVDTLVKYHIDKLMVPKLHFLSISHQY